MMTLAEAYERWPTQEDCRAALSAARWPEGVRCAYCRSAKVSRHAEQGRGDRHQCSACRKSFTVTVGMPMHHAKADLQPWITLVSLMLEPGHLTSVAAGKHLDLDQAKAWRMMAKLKKATPEQWDVLRRVVLPAPRVRRAAA